jgi:NAD(P)-dependent dehydrogenase (short-subunit alcohol dehydrogenase family)
MLSSQGITISIEPQLKREPNRSSRFRHLFVDEKAKFEFDPPSVGHVSGGQGYIMKASELFSVENKKALITGGASGIGLAISEVLSENGAHVAIIDRDAEALDREASRLTKLGYAVDAHQGDVSHHDFARVVDTAIGKLGGLDILFANAGISGGPGPAVSREGHFEEIDLAQWQRTMGVNLTGFVHTLKASIPTMKRQNSGKIIVTSSVAGLRASTAIAYSYTASKAAVTLLTKQLSMELAPHNVHVNGIAPGPFKTNIAGGRFHNTQIEENEASKVPLGRIADPLEIKGLALLLASNASSFITGTVVAIDGGRSAAA